MKIVVIGSTGTIGTAVVRALVGRYEVIGASRHGEPKVDLADPSTVAALFRAVPEIDAVICCAGSAAWKPLAQLTDEDFASSLNNKLMGQVRLARLAMTHLRDAGSITLTSGVLAQKPMPSSAAVALVNAGLEGFVRAAALEAPRGIRINVVSPPWVTESLQKNKMEVEEHLGADVVAKAYVAAVEGRHQGAVLDPEILA
jgi:NAD(P)-dependent dehydrogenase (short-subunit alcohol dehydrogenase family)